MTDRVEKGFNTVTINGEGFDADGTLASNRGFIVRLKLGRITGLLVGVALIGALAGCGPDSQSKTDGENNATTPVQAPLPAPPEPPPPPVNAKGEPGTPVNITRPVRPKDTFDDHSALKFIKYTDDAIQHAIINNDPSILDDLCSPGTDYCQAHRDFAERVPKDTSQPFKFSLRTNIKINLIPPDDIADYYLTTQIFVPHHYERKNNIYYDMGVGEVKEYRALTLDFNNNKWTVRNVTDMPADKVKDWF